MPEINYFWDEIEDNVVREYDENNNTIASYTTEPTLYGSVLSQDRGGEKRCFQFDGQGNTTELTDPSGAVTDMHRYSAFGETTASNGATSTPLGFGGRWGYHTSGGDSISVRRRDLAIRLGRWLSVDPLAVIRQWSFPPVPYTYTSNRPPNSHDPSGLEPTGACLHCEKYYKETIVNNATYKKCWAQFVEFANRIADVKRRDDCLKVKFTCDDKCDRGVAAHVTYPWPEKPWATIYLCSSHTLWWGTDVELAAEPPCHELAHVTQLKSECTDRPFDPTNCLHRVAMEMLAYYCTGKCDSGKSCRMLPEADEKKIKVCKGKKLSLEDSLYLARYLDDAIAAGKACAITTRIVGAIR